MKLVGGDAVVLHFYIIIKGHIAFSNLLNTIPFLLILDEPL